MVFIESIVFGILSKDMSSLCQLSLVQLICYPPPRHHRRLHNTHICTFAVQSCGEMQRMDTRTRASVQHMDTRQYRSIGPGLGDDLSPHIISSPDCHCNVQLHCVSLKYSHLNLAPTIKGLHVNTNGPRTKPRNSSVCCSFQLSRIQIEHMQSNACALQKLSTGLRKSQNFTMPGEGPY